MTFVDMLWFPPDSIQNPSKGVPLGLWIDFLCDPFSLRRPQRLNKMAEISIISKRAAGHVLDHGISCS